ncbi:ATP-binding protein [Streptomyces sp. MSC1_001]|jgi:anti-sigma regulatory factor (Ser/Thr protein kinase)|uniref:ATP-binding protein n=1 Tax=Streptomyces sp. MSC1_001 TaxID=2909263 RepID=UPI00202F73EB|nr:ATP-binding protein [Streptomyces sp. MSC1_001]
MTALTVTPPIRADAETPAPSAHAACSAVTGDACVPALRHFVLHCARRLGLSQDLRDTACLVASELITNAVLHSGSHSVAVLVGIEGHQLSISVHDRGRWHTRTESRHSPADDGIVCGRGLDLVEALVDRLAITTSLTGTVVRASLCIDTLVPATRTPGEVAVAAG